MHSSTFYLSSLWLSSNVRTQVGKLYFFCRYLDDLADKPGIKNEDTLNAILDDVKHGTTYQPITCHIHSLIEQFQIPASVPISLINGIQKDFSNVQIKSQKALLHYAYEVAGTVGIMMAHILDTKNIIAQHHAIDLSIAMQLTNIARDVYEDALIDRRYLPGNWTNHITPDHIVKFDASTQIQINQGIYKTIMLAENYYNSGIDGIRYLPKKYQGAIIRAARLYQRIGHTLLNNANPFNKGKTRVSLFNKMPILLQAPSPMLPMTTHAIDLHTDISHLPFTHHV